MSSPSPITRLDASARYSEAVVHNGVAYLAGQVAADDALLDCASQTASVLAQVDAMLARCGSDKSRLLSATVYLTSLDHYAAMNEVWAAWLPAGCAPASPLFTPSLSGGPVPPRSRPAAWRRFRPPAPRG